MSMQLDDVPTVFELDGIADCALLEADDLSADLGRNCGSESQPSSPPLSAVLRSSESAATIAAKLAPGCFSLACTALSFRRAFSSASLSPDGDSEMKNLRDLELPGGQPSRTCLAS